MFVYDYSNKKSTHAGKYEENYYYKGIWEKLIPHSLSCSISAV